MLKKYKHSLEGNNIVVLRTIDGNYQKGTRFKITLFVRRREKTRKKVKGCLKYKLS